MTLKDFIDITAKMGIDPNQQIEILCPKDSLTTFSLVRSKDGGLYIFPHRDD